MNLDPETDLVLERTIMAPRELLWECWTHPEHVRKFFVPHPHTVVACEIDLRVGGRFNTAFDVKGTEMRNEGVYLDVQPHEKLVFTDGYSEGWKPKPDPFMTAIILFEDAGQGVTKYTAIARHRSADSRQTHEEMGFFDGWGTVADQLEAYAQSLES